jgi:Protein similar to CwfJ C-terminus 2
MNAVAVDSSNSWQFKHVFDDKSEEHNLAIETMPTLTEANQLPDSGAYFYAELPDGTTMLTRQMRHFPIHFGREVLCAENLLNCEDKVDWKECQLEKEDEVDMVARFRESYKEFDFTL